MTKKGLHVKQPLLIWLVLFVLLFCAGLMYILKYHIPLDSVPLITTFEECAKAGYPVTLSYPSQCTTPDGKSFTQEVSQSPEPTTPEEEEVFCTQDVFECPNGIFVGRVGPKCEFAPCPSM